MQVKLWKDYKILFLIIFGFVCFFTNINNANALILKESHYFGNMSESDVSGEITSGQEKWSDLTLTNTVDLSPYNYDYVIFRIRTKDVILTTHTSSNLVNDYRCTEWRQNGSTIYCNTTTNLADLSVSTYAPFDYTLSVYIQDSNGWGVTCYFDDTLKDHIICPKVNNGFNWSSFKKVTYITRALITDNVSKVTFLYKLDKTIYFGNAESTDIINALTNTGSQLHLDMSTIQQQNTQQQQYLENDNTTGTQQQVSTDFSNVSSDLSTASGGVNDLTNIIMAPLTLFMDLSTSSCTPIHLVVPFVNTAFDLPCMSTIYNAYFSTFLTIFTTVIASITCYWISINTIKLIKELLDCDNDRIEVLDL